MERVYGDRLQPVSRVGRPFARCSEASYTRLVLYRHALPQLDGAVLLTDGGMETTLIFSDGFELPCFASFPLLEHDEGRAAMWRYFEPYLEVARRHGMGFVLEANTWRANPAWGTKLGYSLDDLAEANRRSVRFVEEIREQEETPDRPFVVSAPIGPEGDAYDPESRMTATAAESFHAWQIGVLSDTTADLVTGLTLTYSDEAIGGRGPAKSSRSAAVGDFDGDGRLDLVVSNFNDRPYLYMNRFEPRPWLGLRLTGTKSNRDAIGAMVRVFVGDRVLLRQVDAAGGYLAQSSRTLHFGLGRATAVDRVEIRWPSGIVQTIEHPAIGKVTPITEPVR